MTRHTAAIDLGGTSVRAALVDDEGRVLQRIRRPTPVTDDDPAFLATMVDELCAAATMPSASTADEVVIGIPGVIDHDAGALVRAPNLNQQWIPLLNADWLGRRFGLPVALANDADLAAVGEASFGSGRSHRDVVYVTISTGVGAGATFGGRLVRGRRSGLEIGHTIVDHIAAAGGRPGTVEELGAGPAIAKAAAEAGIAERDGAFTDLVRAGHPVAGPLWERAMDAVAAGITNVAWLLSPDVVVIGGGVGANNGDIVLPRIAAWLERHGPAVDEPIALATASLGDDAGLAGAARWFAAVTDDGAQ